MNIAVSESVALPANSVSTTVRLRTERGRVYTVITDVGLVGGAVRIKYFDEANVERLNQVLQAPRPGIYSVGADTVGNLEVTYEYAAAAAERVLPLVIAKEITV